MNGKRKFRINRAWMGLVLCPLLSLAGTSYAAQESFTGSLEYLNAAGKAWQEDPARDSLDAVTTVGTEGAYEWDSGAAFDYATDNLSVKRLLSNLKYLKSSFLTESSTEPTAAPWPVLKVSSPSVKYYSVNPVFYDSSDPAAYGSGSFLRFGLSSGSAENQYFRFGADVYDFLDNTSEEIKTPLALETPSFSAAETSINQYRAALADQISQSLTPSETRTVVAADTTNDEDLLTKYGSATFVKVTNDGLEDDTSGGALSVTGRTDNIKKDAIFLENSLKSETDGVKLAGGALALVSTDSNLLSASFVRNSVESKGNATGGGASISGDIQYINGLFLSNSALGTGESSLSAGGALTFKQGTAGRVLANFVGNLVTSQGQALGGALYLKDASTSLLAGDFVFNLAQGKNVLGGALVTEKDSGTMQLGALQSHFIQNAIKLTGENGTGQGGAVYNGSGASIDGVLGNFVYNFIGGSGKAAEGGALYNAGTINLINGDFVSNGAESLKTSSGGALYVKSGSTVGAIKGALFSKNYAKVTGDAAGQQALGGAIYSESALTLTNVSLTDNWAEGAAALGGAIYSKANLTISANGASTPVTISGNYVKQGETRESQAIYLDNDAKLVLNSYNQGSFTLADKVAAKSVSSTVAIDIQNKSTFTLNAPIVTATTTATVGSDSSLVVSQAENVNGKVINSGTYRILGGNIQNDIEGAGLVKIEGDTTLKTAALSTSGTLEIADHAVVSADVSVISSGYVNTLANFTTIQAPSSALPFGFKLGNSSTYHVTSGNLTSPVKGEAASAKIQIDVQTDADTAATVATVATQEALKDFKGSLVLSDGAKLDVTALDAATLGQIAKFELTDNNEVVANSAGRTAVAALKMDLPANKKASMRLNYGDTVDASSVIGGTLVLEELTFTSAFTDESYKIYNSANNKLKLGTSILESLAGTDWSSVTYSAVDGTLSVGKADSVEGAIAAANAVDVATGNPNQVVYQAGATRTPVAQTVAYDLTGNLTVQADDDGKIDPGTYAYNIPDATSALDKSTDTLKLIDASLEDVAVPSGVGAFITLGRERSASLEAKNSDVVIDMDSTSPAVFIEMTGTSGRFEVGASEGKKVTIKAPIKSSSLSNVLELTGTGSVVLSGFIDPITVRSITTDATMAASSSYSNVLFEASGASGSLTFEDKKSLYDSTVHTSSMDGSSTGSGYQNALSFAGGSIHLDDGTVSDDAIKLGFVSLSANSDLYVNADLTKKKMDQLELELGVKDFDPAETWAAFTAKAESATGKLSVHLVPINAVEFGEPLKLLFTDNATLQANTVAADEYLPFGGDPHGIKVDYASGYFTLTRTKPALSYFLEPATLQVSDYLVQVTLFEKLFNQIDTHRERCETQFYAQVFGGFDRVRLQQGIRVQNKAGGALLGVRSKEFKAKRYSNLIYGLGLYAGLDNGRLHFANDSAIGANNTGAMVGLNYWMSRNNLNLDVAADLGFGSHHAHGYRHFHTRRVGVASRLSYDFNRVKSDFRVQPRLDVNYVHVGLGDYYNAKDQAVQVRDLSALSIAPGVQLTIGENRHAWHPFASVMMHWSLFDHTKFTVGSTAMRLADLHVKPYAQASLGLQRDLVDGLSGVIQVDGRVGGRAGFSVSAGLNWQLDYK